jgi:hypothetical protein
MRETHPCFQQAPYRTTPYPHPQTTTNHPSPIRYTIKPTLRTLSVARPRPEEVPVSTTTFLLPGPLPPCVVAPWGLKKSKRDGAAARRVPGRRLDSATAPNSGDERGAAARAAAVLGLLPVRAEGAGTMKALVAARVAPRASRGL